MTGCRIGRIKLKSGGEIIPIHGKNLTLHKSNFEWPNIDAVNIHIRNGNCRAVIVCMMTHDDQTFTGMDKKKGVSSTEMIGLTGLMSDFVMEWAKK